MPEAPLKLLGFKGLGPLQRPGVKIRVSPRLLEAAESDADEVLRRLETSRNGLSEEEAARRLRKHGPNVVAQEGKHGWLRLLLRACVNPLVVLLLVLAAVSFLTELERNEGLSSGDRHDRDGVPGGLSPIRARAPGGGQCRQTQVHDPRDRNGRARRSATRGPTGSWSRATSSDCRRGT